MLLRRSQMSAHLGGEVSLGLELLEEGGEEEGGEEEDDGPEENIGDVGTVVAARRAHKLPLKLLTCLHEEGKAELSLQFL